MEWLGHSSFRVSIDHFGQTYVIYIDPWFEGNAKCPLPRDSKHHVIYPTDANLILVSHGHGDHMGGAAPMLAASKKPDCKIACIYELGEQLHMHKGVQSAKLLQMNKGGSVDLGWVRITMTSAEHSSSCGFHEGHLSQGGEAAGWIVCFPQLENLAIYHAGDTGVFGDMALIDDLYRAQYVLLPIGGNYTMGPVEAAYAVKKYFKHAHTVVPMHFGTFPALTGTFEQFVSEIDKLGVMDKKIVNPNEKLLGKWIDLIG
jgi:L-ascorbate metabolism protein UlaG (beta-lactamase superfamily)